LKAVIPGAKKKEGMFPFSETLPTALMPIAGKKVVEHSIEALKENGIDEIYVVTNYLEEKFEEEFSERNDVNIVHQEELSGTAEAIRTCDFIEDDFLVLNGDVIVSENDLGRLMEKFDKDGASILATYENRPEKFGVLSIENDEVVEIEEKPDDPENPLINTGIYAFTPEIFESLESLGEEERSLTDAVRKEIEDGGARFLLIEDYWIDIGSGEKLWEADRIKREEMIQETEIHEDAEVSDDVSIQGKAWIGPDAEIEAGAVLKGKCFIGAESMIGPDTVVENSTVMPRAQLDQCSVEDSLLFRETILDPFVSVQNCVLGEECDVKSGTGVRESLIGARSFIELNNSILGTKFVPDARTDIGEISK
jgi:NDP-sugar pyrophosphorylase family protein